MESDNQIKIRKAFKKIQENHSHIPKHELWLVYEFCQFSIIHTHLILDHTKQHRLKKLLNDMMSYPKVANQYIEQIFAKHQELIQNQEEYEKQEELKMLEEKNLKEEELQKLKEEIIEPGIIMYLTDHYILDILQYLDARSLIKFSFTCKQFRELITQKPIFLFKKFCINLYQNLSPLPIPTPFISIQKYVNSNRIQFDPNLILRINNDVRKVAWKCYGDQRSVNEIYKTGKKYFQKFDNYYKMFMLAPRIHFCGYYYCKEKYIKFGEKSMSQTFTPVIQVIYYRYFRFLPDGRIYFVLSNKKLKNDKISNNLTENFYFNNNDNIQLNDNNSQYNNSGQPLIEKENNQGEFIIKDDMVYVRYNRAQTIFQYNMRIRGSSVGAHDMLMVENYSMYQIDLNYTYNIYSSNADDSSKVYKYKPLQQIKDDIDEKKYRKIKYMSL